MMARLHRHTASATGTCGTPPAASTSSTGRTTPAAGHPRGQRPARGRARHRIRQRPACWTYMDKRITAEMTRTVVRPPHRARHQRQGLLHPRLPHRDPRRARTTRSGTSTTCGTSPTTHPGRFRASVFEFRPYPGTPDWHRLLATGRYTRRPAARLRRRRPHRRRRRRGDARNATSSTSRVDIQFGEADLRMVRNQLVILSREQHDRAATAHA